jgi:hypothetical protein
VAGGGAGQELQEIEGGPLAGEHRSGKAGNLEESLICGDPVPVIGGPCQLDRWIQLTEDLGDPGAAAEDGGLPGNDLSGHTLIGGHQLGSDIATADVLDQGDRHLLGEVGRETQHLPSLI